MMTEKIIKKNKQKGHYFAGEAYDVLKMKPITPETARAYEDEAYAEIFSSYEPDRHVVEYNTYGQCSYLGLIRPLSRQEAEGRRMPAGFYRVKNKLMTDRVLFVPMEVPEQDRYVPRTDGSDRISSDLRTFFESVELYEEMDVIHRRGALLFGPPGNGKTFSIIRCLKTLCDEEDLLVFYIHPEENNLREFFELNALFRDRSTVVVMEEITEFAKRDQQLLLNFLDGEFRWSRHYNIATTNYPEELPGNLVDRPGRFDMLIPVDHPDAEERRRFLKHYLDTDHVPDDLVEDLADYSIAYIKEMVLRSRLYDRSLREVLEEFQEQKRKIRNEFNRTSESLGFGARTAADNGTGVE